MFTENEMTVMTGRAWPGGLSSIWDMNSRYPPISSSSKYSCCCSHSFPPGNPPNLQHGAVLCLLSDPGDQLLLQEGGLVGKDVKTAKFTKSLDKLVLTVGQ